MALARRSAGRPGSTGRRKEARAFYATIVAATAAGVLMNFTPIDPIKALFWSAVINGVVAVPIMAIMMLMAANPRVMGEFTIGRSLKILATFRRKILFFRRRMRQAAEARPAKLDLAGLRVDLG